MKPCYIIDKLCIFVNFGLDSQGCLWIYIICKQWSWFVFYELIRVLVYIGHVNYLCKLAICLTKFVYLWILIWIHKDACEYAYGNSEIDLFLWVNWGFGFHWACEFWVWILVNNQNYLFFMIKLGFYFPLANSIGVLVSIGYKLIYFGLISNLGK